jgi:hypothetical protein
MELCCFLGSKVTNLFMTPQMTKCLGIKIEKLVDPIMVHLAQGIVRPLFIVMKRVELFCGGVILWRISPCVT